MSDTLELLILDSGGTGRAVAYGRYGSDTAISYLPSNLVSGLVTFRDRLSKAAAGLGPRPTPTELAGFGQELFGLLVRDQLSSLYSRLPPQHVRIQVLSNEPSFQALPWEYLQEPNAPSGPNALRSVVRIVPTMGLPDPSRRSLQKKLRVLFAYADPIDQPGVGWEDIYAKIDQEFKSRLAPEKFEIDVIEAATVDALTTALLDKDYDIFHFNGHGEVTSDATGHQAGHIVLVNSATNKSEALSAEKLAVLLKGRRLQLVVLSACNSATGDFAKAYAVVAHALVLQGVPAVVANQFAVTTTVAATFARGFYQSLLKDGDVDQAVAAGRLVLHMQPTVPKDAALEWGIPTLYRHIGASRLFQNE